MMHHNGKHRARELSLSRRRKQSERGHSSFIRKNKQSSCVIPVLVPVHSILKSIKLPPLPSHQANRETASS